MNLTYNYRSNFKNTIVNTLNKIYSNKDEIFVFHSKSNYLVSNKGTIKSPYSKKILTQFPNNNGYKMVNIKFLDGTRRCCMVHRLVMESFINILGNETENFEVNHIDGNKLNNDLNNLEWMTRKENLDHARKNGLFASKMNGKRFKLQNQDVNDIIEFRKLGFGLKDIAKSFNITPNYVTTLLKNNGKRKLKCLT